MRRPNYKVFVYDHSGRYIDTIKVWAAQGNSAVEKAKQELEKKKKNTIFYSFVPKEEK